MAHAGQDVIIGTLVDGLNMIDNYFRQVECEEINNYDKLKSSMNDVKTYS